ncbi:RDD family protein [uncultured Lacinutrix sp.]|uniref:RDD family protein n=1 Tax=uncultured Lacinutrix sp. TaxID=574032 RepID=UPI00260E931F|nr:RDD family protein [uncultured Lacinutrix sp.]
MEKLNLPTVFLRVKAAFIDTILIMMIIYTAAFFLGMFNTIDATVKGVIYVFIFILYEPLFVSLFGASLGHIFCDLRVQKDDKTKKNISLPMAIIRFFLKTFLGWISLLSINSDSKKRAIHDKVVKSVVIYLGKENI